jgi:hypothetical protein
MIRSVTASVKSCAVALSTPESRFAATLTVVMTSPDQENATSTVRGFGKSPREALSNAFACMVHFVDKQPEALTVCDHQ